MLRVILFIIACLAFASCEQPSTLTGAEKQAIIDAITQTMDHYFDDVRTHGLTAEFRYLDSSENFFWVPPGYASAISYDSVAFVLKQNAPLFRSVENALDTIRIIPLSRELASYTARPQSTMTDTRGKTLIVSLVETGLFIKRAGGWKLHSGQTAIIK